MSAWTRVSVLLQDNAGNIAKVVFAVAAAAFDPSGSVIQAVATAIQGVTKALNSRQESGTEAGAVGATNPGTGAYSTVEDRLTLTFRGDDNSTFTYEVPAPISTDFDADTVTANPGDTHMAAYISFIQTYCVGSAGQALTFVKGERTSKKQMKK
jgi:hypothetical protein